MKQAKILIDEERRLASHQAVKVSIDDDVNARMRRQSARVEPKESAKDARRLRTEKAPALK